MIQRARRRLVADRRAHRLAADDTPQAHLTHQPLHRAAGDGEALPLQLSPDLSRAVDGEVLGEHPGDLGLQTQVPARPRRQPGGIAPLGELRVVGGWGDRQNLADRLDPVGFPVIVDKADHRLNGRSSSAWAK